MKQLLIYIDIYRNIDNHELYPILSCKKDKTLVTICHTQDNMLYKFSINKIFLNIFCNSLLKLLLIAF